MDSPDISLSDPPTCGGNTSEREEDSGPGLLSGVETRWEPGSGLEGDSLVFYSSTIPDN